MRYASSYGIVDRKLLFDRYLHRMSHEGAALYLFLVLAADRDGRSYYSDRSIGEILRLTSTVLAGAKSELIKAGLVDYQRPYFRVKNLSQPGSSRLAAFQPSSPLRPPSEPQPIRGIVPAGLRMFIKSLEDR